MWALQRVLRCLLTCRQDARELHALKICSRRTSLGTKSPAVILRCLPRKQLSQAAKTMVVSSCDTTNAQVIGHTMLHHTCRPACCPTTQEQGTTRSAQTRLTSTAQSQTHPCRQGSSSGVMPQQYRSRTWVPWTAVHALLHAERALLFEQSQLAFALRSRRTPAGTPARHSKLRLAVGQLNDAVLCMFGLEKGLESRSSAFLLGQGIGSAAAGLSCICLLQRHCALCRQLHSTQLSKMS